MIGDPTFPRMYCARNDAAKGGHVMHLYASAVLIHARYVVIIMPAYTRHNEVLHGQSSPLSFSYDIPCPYHTLVHSPFFLFTLHFRIFTDRKKNISIEFDREIDTTNLLSSQPILVSSILQIAHDYSRHLNYHFTRLINCVVGFKLDWRHDLKYL